MVWVLSFGFHSEEAKAQKVYRPEAAVELGFTLGAIHQASAVLNTWVKIESHLVTP